MVNDLIVFEMSYFDEILITNFLGKYKAGIEYKKKKVLFSLDNNDEFSFGNG